MEMRAEAGRASQFLVLGMIDPQNSASRRMCLRHDFAHIGEEGDYELWARLVAIST
jgi:hypothetical protein